MQLNSRLLLLSAAQPPEDIRQHMSLQPLKAVAQLHLAGSIVLVPSSEVLVLSSKMLRAAECQTGSIV